MDGWMEGVDQFLPFHSIGSLSNVFRQRSGLMATEYYTVIVFVFYSICIWSFFTEHSATDLPFGLHPITIWKLSCSSKLFIPLRFRSLASFWPSNLICLFTYLRIFILPFSPQRGLQQSLHTQIRILLTSPLWNGTATCKDIKQNIMNFILIKQKL